MHLFDVPTDRDALAQHYTLEPRDLALIATRRGVANRIGFAVQIALLCHPGFGLSDPATVAPALVAHVAGQLGIDAAVFATYARREPTVADHARHLEQALGLRSYVRSDLPLMIGAATKAAGATDKGAPIVVAVMGALREAGIVPPASDTIERAGLAGRARARKEVAKVLVGGLSETLLTRLDSLLVVDEGLGRPRLSWMKDVPRAPKPSHVSDLLDRLAAVRALELDPEVTGRIHADRLALLVREGRITPASILERYVPSRRRAIVLVSVLDLEQRLTDAALSMADRLIGTSFTRGKTRREKTFVASSREVGRLMRLLEGTAGAVATAVKEKGDALAAIDAAVGLDRLIEAKPRAAEIAGMAAEDPLVRAADRWVTLRKYGPKLIEAIRFEAGRADARTVAAVAALRDLNRSGKRELPRDTPMPFKPQWRKLVTGVDGKPDRRLYETALFAHLRNKLRSGDLWVERSTNYRRFDSYLLPLEEARAVVAPLGFPCDADAWLAARADRLDRRLQQLGRHLDRGTLEGVSLKNGRLSIAPVRAEKNAAADALADRIGALMPRIRITELLHEVARETGFLSAFTNVRTQQPVGDGNALLAVILADATNLGLSRMAEASHGVTRDQLFWTRDAFIRDETYKAALGRIIDAHHALPIAAVWGDGTTAASDGQFFRSAKRGAGAGQTNARHGIEPGYCFYTHTSDQHGPMRSISMAATEHEAPFVLDGLLHHSTGLGIAEHYTDTGGSSDHVHLLCDSLGIRFCPRLRDFPDRRLACLEPPSRYPALAGLLGKRVRTDLIRAHWPTIVRLVAILKAGTVAPSILLKKLAAYERQNQLDLAMGEAGRLVRTEFMIDWMEDPALRRRSQGGLNKSEQRHTLASVVCTYGQGRVADHRQAAQEYRASGLNLLIAAIVYWNSTYMADAVAHLRRIGDPAPDHLLAHTSPVEWEHIGFSGDFLWHRAAMLPAGRRPLNQSGTRNAA